jgi:CO/xanthine dehydrogenase Mo-binding subunit
MSAAGPHSASRRAFVKRGVALTVGFSLLPAIDGMAQQGADQPLPVSLQNNRMLDGWLRVNADGSVIVFTGKVELGQGILTALAQIVADELDVDLKRIRMVSGDTSRTPNEGVTAGSQSIEHSGTALRFAAAEVRQILLDGAARQLGAPAASLAVKDGVISAAGGANTSYWALCATTDLKRQASARIAPKAPAQHRLIGASVARLDIPAKVSGGAVYVQDIRLPGMLFGRVVRPPSPRARLLSVDVAAAKALPGVVVVVRDGDFLAVAAEREEQAIGAMHFLRESAQWEASNDLPASDAQLFAQMKAMRLQTSIASAKNLTAAPVNAVKTLEADYTKPFQAHGSIGPSCSVAHAKDGKMFVWSHTQGAFGLRTDLAKVLGMAPADVVVAHRDGAGCYGHNGADDVALDAALIARQSDGRPVKVQWMRQDEFGWEPKGSAMAFHLRASLDQQGNVVDWEHELWSHSHNMRPGDSDGINLLASWHLKTPFKPAPGKNVPLPNGGGDRNAIPLYQFPRQQVINHLIPDSAIRVSALRTLGAYGNVFALESFMDELAAAAGVDPVAFRLRHLGDERARAVIETVAAKANWQRPHVADGIRGRGIAFAQYKNHAVYVAVVAQVEVDRQSGEIRVSKLFAAADAGLIINPDGFRNQIEGGLIQSSSWTIREAVAFDRSQMLTQSWADYPILRFPDVPQVEVTLINRPLSPSVGVGEGAQGPAAAAIANAVANALGARLRDLPLTPDRVRRAIAARA